MNSPTQDNHTTDTKSSYKEKAAFFQIIRILWGEKTLHIHESTTNAYK